MTGSGGDCGMLLAFGWITVELVGTNYESCSTHTLDNSGIDDMNPGILLAIFITNTLSLFM